MRREAWSAVRCYALHPPPLRLATAPMSDIAGFGLVVLLVAAALGAAVLATKLGDLLPIPAPAIFLIAASAIGDVWPRIGNALSLHTVERIATVALIVILFDGGLKIGWRRMRAAAAPVLSLGIVGTFATAALMAVFSHWLFGFSWTAAGLLGAALAPTDPAVMFSVLGKREVGGRSGTILEGESGANDPVGIALMVALLELARHPGGSFLMVIRELAVQLSVGLAVGVAGAWLLVPLVRRIALPSEALYPLRTLAVAGVVYGAATVAHGSGFLAVFVAGLLASALRTQREPEVERVLTALSSLAEIVVFAALGLTFPLTDLGQHGLWSDGILLALLLVFIARPLAVGPLLLPTRLRAGERAFIMWGGLKGAVPILLGAFAVLDGAQDGPRIYGIVFVVVGLSVLVQGTTIPFAARRLGIPMRTLY